MKKSLFHLLSILVVSLGISANAAPVTGSDPMIFVAPSQSLWGGGGSTDFGVVYDSTLIGYDIGASAGSVSGELAGKMEVSYTSYLSQPGSASVALEFLLQPGGTISSLLGAWANLDFLGIDLINWNPVLDVEITSAGQLNQTDDATDRANIANRGVDFGILELGAAIGIEQENQFIATGLDGQLAYSRRGSSEVNTLSFQGLNNVNSLLQLMLLEEGLWEFWFDNLALRNEFSTSFDAYLLAYEEHVELQWERKCVGRSWWRTCWWIPDVTTEYNEYTLGELDLYTPASFELVFEEVSEPSRFLIYVGIPEPGTLLLLILGLLVVLKSTILKHA